MTNHVLEVLTVVSQANRIEEVHFGPSDLERIARASPKTTLIDQLFMLIAGRAHSKGVATGTRLPSVRQLADDCRVSRDSVARAYERLVAHGVVEARRGSGYFVKNGPRRVAPSAMRPALSGPMSQGLVRWRSLLVRPNMNLVSRTGSGSFPASWQDEAALSTAVRGVARQNMRPLAQYAEAQGYAPLRQHLQIKLQEIGVAVEPANIIVTAGATESIHLICQAFLRAERDSVITEEPGPPMLTDRFLSTGLEIHRVPRLSDGPDLDMLRSICEKHRPRAFFLSTVLHNPTCTQISPPKVFQLLQLAEEFDLLLVEDDTYTDLFPGTSAVARLATLDQLKRVIYISSFSKTVSPGLRCGFLAASAERIDWLTTYRFIQDISGNALSERILYKLLSGGSYRRHCEQLRARLAELRAPALAELERWGLTPTAEADSGLFSWVSLGGRIDAMSVADRMLEQGHLLAPGPVFGNDDMYKNYLRVNLAEVGEGGMLPALGKLLGRRG